MYCMLIYSNDKSPLIDENKEKNHFDLFTTLRGVYNFPCHPTPPHPPPRHPSLRPIELQPREPYHKGPKPRES